MKTTVEARISRLEVSAYRVPTDVPESDGTLAWDSTTLVLVEAQAGDRTGLGYTYADRSTAVLIQDKLREVVLGQDAMGVQGIWDRMVRQIRNLGRPGIASMAIAAIDIAMWDLRGRLLGLPIFRLLGADRASVPAYGSGGFTSYPVSRLQEQLAGWVKAGFRRVKMKIGREPREDVKRVRAAREAIGPEAQLFVDANGAYSRKQALTQAEAFAASEVSWFEEPVSSDDLEGLRLMRDRAPAAMRIAAGEYGYDLPYFHRMLAAGAVDVLQADATRCAGITGFLEVGRLCSARHVPLSAHTAPSLHAQACAALPCAQDVEYFHDHARIEELLFEGAARPVGGELRLDLSRPGLGLEFKHADAKRYAIEV